MKNGHPVFCAPNEFPLIPQNTKTLRVSIVLLHTTSVIRVSFHEFFPLTVSRYWALLWVLFENAFCVNKAYYHYSKEAQAYRYLSIYLFSLFTNIFAYVLFESWFIITENAPSWNRKEMHTAFRCEELKDRFRFKNLNIDGGIIWTVVLKVDGRLDLPWKI